MTIGTVTIGKIKSLNKQCIGTKFVIVGIPLFPIKSIFFINDQEGLELHELNGKSVLKAYLSFFCLFFGILGIFLQPLFGVGFLAVSAYFFWFFEKSTPEENKFRILLEKSTGINALPEYLDSSTALKLKNNIVQKYRTFQPTATGKDMVALIESGRYERELLPLLFPFIAYHSRTDSNIKYKKLMEKLAKEYKVLVYGEGKSNVSK